MSLANQGIPWFNDWAWRLYKHAPAALDNAVKRCVPWVLPWAALRVPVAILRGPTRHSERSGTVVVAGHQPWADYLPRRFFACAPQREVVGAVPVWALPSFIKRLAVDADITVARVDRVSARLFFGDGFLVVTESIGCRLTLPVDLDKLARVNHGVKYDFRTLRRECLTAEVSHKEADCELFHSTMHVPFVRNRYGDFAVIHNLHQLRRSFRHGVLIWVRRANQRIAGGLYEQRRNVLRSVALGTSEGDLALMKVGALAALHIFAIGYAQDRGCTSIDLGGTPPILNDGLLRFKKKWGSQLIDEPQTPYDYLVRWEQPNEQVFNFLADTPLICRNDRGLMGLTALKPKNVTTADQVSTIHRSLWMPGLHEIAILTPSGYELGHGGPPKTCLVNRQFFDQLTR